MRDSIIFYRSFYEAIKNLPPDDFKRTVSAIMDYGLDDKIPETSGIEKTIYLLVKPQIDVNNRRYQNGAKGGRPANLDNQTITKAEPSNNQTITKAEPNVNVNENVNVKDIKKECEEKKRFAPPTRQNVADYVSEKGYGNVDIDRFMDYYTSNGWMVGKNRMKDWKAAVRNWSRGGSQRQELTTKGSVRQELTAKTPNRFRNFNERQYDYEALERQLLEQDGR